MISSLRATGCSRLLIFRTGLRANFASIVLGQECFGFSGDSKTVFDNSNKKEMEEKAMVDTLNLGDICIFETRVDSRLQCQVEMRSVLLSRTISKFETLRSRLRDRLLQVICGLREFDI